MVGAMPSTVRDLALKLEKGLFHLRGKSGAWNLVLGLRALEHLKTLRQRRESAPEAVLASGDSRVTGRALFEEQRGRRAGRRTWRRCWRRCESNGWDFTQEIEL